MKLRAVVIVWVVLSLSVMAAAQTSRGIVSGSITDPSGAVIPGASVTLTNIATAVSRSTTSNDEGFYRFDAVDLGIYQVTLSASGFGTIEKTNIVVNANQTSTIDAQLTPGGQNITIDVFAETGVVLQTEAPVRGGNISPRQVTELPFAGRNPVALALTLPGVSSNRAGFGADT
nr:carboxypeptidase regulatory-like domain-containing protein [Pyrinomonadaceae bacterium]